METSAASFQWEGKGPRVLSFEGAPCVGKTRAIQAIATTLRVHGFDVVVHEEKVCRPLLDMVFQDANTFAAWFQLLMLKERHLTLSDIDAATRAAPETIHLVDRSRGGDYSFFLYHRDVTKTIAGAVADEYLKCMRSRPPPDAVPRAVIYLTAPVDVLLQRVLARGIPGEIEAYDAAFYKAMDAKHRKAFRELGDPVVEVDWSQHYEHGLVPPERCIELLKLALRNPHVAVGEEHSVEGQDWVDS